MLKSSLTHFYNEIDCHPNRGIKRYFESRLDCSTSSIAGAVLTTTFGIVVTGVSVIYTLAGHGSSLLGIWEINFTINNRNFLPTPYFCIFGIWRFCNAIYLPSLQQSFLVPLKHISPPTLPLSAFWYHPSSHSSLQNGPSPIHLQLSFERMNWNQ